MSMTHKVNVRQGARGSSLLPTRAVWPSRRKTANYNKKEDTEMEYDEIMGARLSAIEARLSGLEERQAALERGSVAIPRRKKRELTPEERVAVRARLLAGQERAKVRREAEAKAQSKKEKANGSPAAAD